MWELDHRKGWAPKNWSFWSVVLEKTLESPLDYKEIKPVNPKGNQLWIFIGRTDAEAEAPASGGSNIWPPDQRANSLENTLMLGKIEGRRRKGGQRMRRWMTSLTQWTWVWASFRTWWRTKKPGGLQSLGLQRVGHDWTTTILLLQLSRWDMLKNLIVS